MCRVYLSEEEWMEQYLEQRQHLLHSGHKLTRHLLEGVVGPPGLSTQMRS